MAGRRRKPNPSSRLLQGQEYSRDDFYKAIYAIRFGGHTKGIACAVNIDEQSNDKTTNSALLITWREIGPSIDCFMDRFSRKNFGKYHLRPLSILSNGYFSFIRGIREKSSLSWDLVCLEMKYLESREQMTDFQVFTITDKLIPLELKYK